MEAKTMSKNGSKSSILDKVAGNKLAEKEQELDAKQKELDAANAVIEDLNDKLAQASYSSPNEKAWLEKMNAKLDRSLQLGKDGSDKGLELVKGLVAYYASGEDMRKVPEKLKAWGQEDSAGYWEKQIDTQNIEQGGLFVADRMLMEDFIDLLRPFSWIFKVGVDVIISDKDKITIPRLDKGFKVKAVGETFRISTSTLRFGKITLNAKKFAGILVISNDWKRQVNDAAFRIIRNDMALAVVEELETQVLYGDGTEHQLRGAHSDPHWGSININAYPDADMLTQPRTLMMNSNIKFNPRELCHLMNPDLYAVFYNMTDDFGEYRYRKEMDMITDDAPFGRINGARVLVTTIIPTDETSDKKTTLYTGLWSEYRLLITRDMSMTEYNMGTVVVTDEDGNEIIQSALQNDVSFIQVISNYDGRCRRFNALLRLENIHTVPAE